MKAYKLNMTRPEFMNRLLTHCDDSYNITEEDLKMQLVPVVIYNTVHILY